jgi:hypothetical protein
MPAAAARRFVIPVRLVAGSGLNAGSRRSRHAHGRARGPVPVPATGQRCCRRPVFGHCGPGSRRRHSAQSPARRFHVARACSRAASTNGRSAPPDNRWGAAISDAGPNARCCTSWCHVTPRPCSPSYARPTAAACLATSSASSPSTCVAASSPPASPASAARRATTRSWLPSRANAEASVRPAQHAAWRTRRRPRGRRARAGRRSRRRRW